MKNLALRWIEGLTKDWLLIFDACALGDRAAELPGRAKGNIIYTSRSLDLGPTLPHDCVAEVTPFTEADAVECLLRVSGRQITYTDLEGIQSAKAIVQELGALPLAIDQAATSIRHLDLSWHTQLERIRKEKVRMLSDPRFKDIEVENPTVYATLELTYEAIRARRTREGRSGRGQAAVMALKVLGMLSFYHHHAIPAADIMRRAAKERAQRGAHEVAPLSEIMKPRDMQLDWMFRLDADGSWDDHCFGVGISVLESFNLVKLGPARRTVSMHVLVHSWARHRLTKRGSRRYGDLARIIIAEAIVVSRKWTDAAFTRSLSPHIAACHGGGSLLSPSRGYLASLHAKMGWYFYLNKDFAQAEQAFLFSLHIWRVELGDSACATGTLELLASLYHEIGRLEEAKDVYLELIEGIHGRLKACEAAAVEAGEQLEPGPVRSGSSVVLSGYMRKVLGGKISSGLSLHAYTRLLGGSDASKGRCTAESDGPSTPRKSKGQDAEADATDDVDVEDLWVEERFYRVDLARVYMDQGKNELGRRMLINALRFLEEQGNISTLNADFLRLENEVKALTEPGDLEYWTKRAHQMFDLIDAQNKLFGSEGSPFFESEGYFQFTVAHANCFLKNRMWDKAYKIYHAACVLFDQTYGPCDKRTLEILRRMVDCLVEGNQCERGVAIARDCVQRAQQCYGKLHQETVMALEKLSEALYFEGLEETDEQQEVLREAFVRAEECLEPRNMTRMRVRVMMGASIQGSEKPVRHVHRGTDTGFRGFPSAWEASWKGSKATLDRLEAENGPNHILVRRFALYVGDGPSKTPEEWLGRVRACWGPNSSRTKNAQEEVDKLRTDTLAQGLWDYNEASSIRGDESKPAHAEGSKAREALGNGTPGGNTPRRGSREETEETEAPSASNSDEAVAPGRAQLRLDFGKNEPWMYMCGFY